MGTTQDIAIRYFICYNSLQGSTTFALERAVFYHFIVLVELVVYTTILDASDLYHEMI